MPFPLTLWSPNFKMSEKHIAYFMVTLGNTLHKESYVMDLHMKVWFVGHKKNISFD